MNCSFNTGLVFVSPPGAPNVIHKDATRPSANPDDQQKDGLREIIEKAHSNSKIAENNREIRKENFRTPAPKPLRARKFVLINYRALQMKRFNQFARRHFIAIPNGIRANSLPRVHIERSKDSSHQAGPTFSIPLQSALSRFSAAFYQPLNETTESFGSKGSSRRVLHLDEFEVVPKLGSVALLSDRCT